MKLKQRFYLFWSMVIGFSLVSLLGGCLGAPAYTYKGVVLDPPLPISNFELIDMKGKPFHFSDLKGEVALIYFGYTTCPDACPLTMYDVKKALADLKSGKDQVRVIFISVDPERDTPEVLSRYMSAFGPEFTGLTDDFARVQEAMKSFGAFAEKDTTSKSAAGYLVSHTTRLYLVDPTGQLLLMYPFGFKAEDLRSDLEHMLQAGTAVGRLEDVYPQGYWQATGSVNIHARLTGSPAFHPSIFLTIPSDY
jgi:protein SCO1/2